MRREIALIWLVLMFAIPAKAQESDNVECISELLAKDLEDMSAEEIQHYEDLLKKRLNLNKSSAFELQESGLFSRYQTVSVLDYISRNGQILSWMELSALDGFSDELVQKLRPFISLEYAPDLDGRPAHDITGRASFRSSSHELRYGYASRYKYTSGEKLSLSLAANRSLDASSAVPDALSGSIGLKFQKIPLRLAAGDFNTRFGQGLALWSGADFSSLNAPASFLRRASGITPSASFTGNGLLTGLASELMLERLSVSVYLGGAGLKSFKSDKIQMQPGCNVTWLWKHGQIGLTHYAEFKGFTGGLHIPDMKTSADFSTCMRGIDLFSELMYDWVKAKPSALAGLVAPIGELWDLAAKIVSSEGEHMFAASSSLDTRKRLIGTVSANMTLYSEPKVNTQDRSLQVKLHTQWEYKFTEYIAAKLRVTERIRSWGETFRTDVRSDLLWSSKPFSVTLRLNVLNCIGTSFLAYSEGGYKTEKVSAYFRQGVFIVDNWDDRIYAYERDAPGCYNSPAFYGRGVWTSFYSSWKLSPLCRLYLRAGYTAYPFMKEKKPGKAELRLQTVFSF